MLCLLLLQASIVIGTTTLPAENVTVSISTLRLFAQQVVYAAETLGDDLPAVGFMLKNIDTLQLRWANSSLELIVDGGVVSIAPIGRLLLCMCSLYGAMAFVKAMITYALIVAGCLIVVHCLVYCGLGFLLSWIVILLTNLLAMIADVVNWIIPYYNACVPIVNYGLAIWYDAAKTSLIVLLEGIVAALNFIIRVVFRPRNEVPLNQPIQCSRLHIFNAHHADHQVKTEAILVNVVRNPLVIYLQPTNFP